MLGHDRVWCEALHQKRESTTFFVFTFPPSTVMRLTAPLFLGLSPVNSVSCLCIACSNNLITLHPHQAIHHTAYQVS
jgi:hypothetical protein